jgi:hypothetical protein
VCGTGKIIDESHSKKKIAKRALHTRDRQKIYPIPHWHYGTQSTWNPRGDGRLGLSKDISL